MDDRAAGVVAGLAEAAEASGVLVEVPRVGVGPAEAGNNTLWSAVRRGGLPLFPASLLAPHLSK